MDFFIWIPDPTMPPPSSGSGGSGFPGDPTLWFRKAAIQDKLIFHRILLPGSSGPAAGSQPQFLQSIQQGLHLREEIASCRFDGAFLMFFPHIYPNDRDECRLE